MTDKFQSNFSISPEKLSPEKLNKLSPEKLSHEKSPESSPEKLISSSESSPESNPEKSSPEKTEKEESSTKESQSSSDEKMQRVKRKGSWKQSPLLVKKKKTDDSGSPSTTSTVESIAIYVEASSLKLFSAFKDWVEMKFFVFKYCSGHIYGIVKTTINQSSHYSRWPSSCACATCKSGEAMRSVLDHVTWSQVFSGEMDNNIENSEVKEILAKARHTFVNNFRDESVKAYLLDLVKCVLRNCCCTHHLSLVNASIPVSTKGHMETSIMVEVWEQLLSGTVGEKTMDTLILSGFPDCSICISTNNAPKIVMFVIEAKSSGHVNNIVLDSSSIGQLCFYLNALGLHYFPESVPLLGLYTEGHKGRLCWAQLERSNMPGKYSGVSYELKITINTEEIDIMTTQGVIKLSDMLMRFIQCFM